MPERVSLREALSVALILLLGIGAVYIFYVYVNTSYQISTRANWLGSLTRIQYDLSRDVFLAHPIDTHACIELCQDIHATTTGEGVDSGALQLLQFCQDPEQDPRLINDAIYDLINHIRSQNRALSSQARMDLNAILGMLSLAILGLATLSWNLWRSRQRYLALAKNQKDLKQEIGERKGAEEALRRSEERLATTLFSIRDAIITTDEKGQIELMNPVAEWMTGWSLAEAKGQKLDDVLQLIEVETGKIAQSLFEHLLRGGGTDPRCQVHVRARNGNSIPVERTVAAMQNAATFLGVVIGLRDTSAQADTMTSMIRYQQDFRQVVERFPDGIIIVRDGILIYANPALCDSLRYRMSSSILGCHLLDLIHPDDRKIARRHLAWPEDQSLPGLLQELRFIRSMGGVAILEVSPGTVVVFDGEPAVLLVTRDATERQRILQRLIQADRLNMVGNITGGIISQISSPLSVLRTGIDSALEALPNDLPDIRKLLEESQQSAQNISQLSHDLLQFTTSAEDRSSIIQLRSLTDACLRLTGLGPRRHTQVEMTGVHGVIAKESLLRHLLVNLLLLGENILDSYPERRWMRLQAEPMAGGRASISLEVDGPPLNSSLLEPGLRLCMDLALDMGSILEFVEDRPTPCLRFILPTPPEEVPLPSTVNSPKGLRILVLDADFQVAEIMQHSLKEHQIFACTSGVEALALLERQEVDLILCEVLMEGISGADFFGRVSSRWPHLTTRIAFMTDGAFTSRSRSFLEAIPNPRLNKPFTLEVLRGLLSHYTS